MYGQGTGPFFFGALSCTGSEDRLADCTTGSTDLCTRENEAGLTCNARKSFVCILIQLKQQKKLIYRKFGMTFELHILLLLNTARCTNGDVRLVGGTTSFNGVVEMCYNEDYGTICDSGFGVPEATVVCAQLGFSRMGMFSYKYDFCLLR